MEQHKRAFRGCWCPPILFDLVEKGDTSIKEAWLLLTIDSFVQNTDGKDCFASNEYLGERCGMNETNTSRAITKLIEMGLLERTGFDGRVRYIRTTWNKDVIKKPCSLEQGRLSPQSNLKELSLSTPLSTEEAPAKSRVRSPRPPRPGRLLDPSGGHATVRQVRSNLMGDAKSFHAIWVAMWNAHHAPARTVLIPKETNAITRIEKRLHSNHHEFRRIVQGYFAETADYYRSHPPSKLDVERYLVGVNGTNGDSLEPQTEVRSIKVSMSEDEMRRIIEEG